MERMKFLSEPGSVSKNSIKHFLPLKAEGFPVGFLTPFPTLPSTISTTDMSIFDTDHPNAYLRGPHPMPAARGLSHVVSGPMKEVGISFVCPSTMRRIRDSLNVTSSSWVSNSSQRPKGPKANKALSPLNENFAFVLPSLVRASVFVVCHQQ